MDGTTIAAIGAVVVAIIGAVASGIVSVVAAIRAGRSEQQAKTSTAILQDPVTGMAAIHQLTNSAALAQAAKIDSLHATVDGLNAAALADARSREAPPAGGPG